MESFAFGRSRILGGILGMLLAALAMAMWPASTSGATNAEIDAAIEKGREYLYKQQKPDGRWEIDARRVGQSHDAGNMQGDTFGGFTAICIYALLASGEKTSDPRIVNAIHFLESADPIGIYSLGLRANVWLYLPSSDKRVRSLAEHDAHAIVNGMLTGAEYPESKGFWGYGAGRGETNNGLRFDHSVSQYGVLGLWASALNGVPIDRAIWERIEAGWESHQFPDGGWSYAGFPPNPSHETISMTAAGVATLFIAGDMLSDTRGTDCRGNVTNDHLERGLQYISKHFNEVTGPYALYGIERIGAASGRKYLGTVDWYATGAEKLVRSQSKDGAWWEEYTGGNLGAPATAFALVFLARGREGVMINKLEYDLTPKTDDAGAVEGNWNQRPRDIFNLSHWTGHQLERELGWQIVSLKVNPDELHEAQVLYIGGDQEMSFSAEEESKLREFVQTGGLILANADCGMSKQTFASSVEALGKRLFPGYQFRDLPTTHPIFVNQPYHANLWKAPQRLRGLSNGVRELIVLIPDADPSRAWQTRSDFAQDISFQLGADIYLYATDRQDFNGKIQTYLVHPDTSIIGDRTTRVARLMVGDNPDPEPGGWQRLGAMMHNQFKLDVDVVPIKLPDKKLNTLRLAHLTGTTKFVLTSPMRQQLVDFVQHGGTLVVDAAGGSAEFADAAIAELKACFGADAEAGLRETLPLSDPLFNQAGAKISEIAYRAVYRSHVVGNLKTPRLNGIRIANRLAVIFSREDLSAGMVGEPMDGIAGYSPQTATQIMRNIVLMAGFAPRPPTTGPAAANALPK